MSPRHCYFLYATTVFFILSTQVNPSQQLSSSISNQYLHYGHPCTHNTECDFRESLVCQDGHCTCPNHTLFDPTRSLCVGKADGPCVFHPTESTVAVRNPCVKYASCDDTENSNATCRCWSSFYTSSSGTCTKKKSHLQPCSKNSECNDRKGLTCDMNAKHCICSRAQYNQETERCEGLPNEHCSNVYKECVENHKCRGGVCRCKFKEVETVNGTIVCESIRHSYGKACGRFGKGGCGQGLRCMEGKCRCKNPDLQVYDRDRRACISKVGGPCITSSDHAHGRNNSKFDDSKFPAVDCVAYAICAVTAATTPPSGNGTCECGNQFIETKKGTCALPHGSDCDTSSKNKNDQCVHPLKCVGHRCGCPNEIDFWEGGRCLRPVGALCWKGDGCVRGAVCRNNNGNKGGLLPGRCRRKAL